MDADQAKKLRAPFKPAQIGKLPKPTKRENPKGKCQECGGWHGLPAVHLDYVGHAAITDRLLEVDPDWTWEPMARDGNGFPLLDQRGGLWINLTVCGVTRPGYGDETNGRGMKEAIGDALRNGAMRFGVGLDLWSKEDLHADDDTPASSGRPEQPARTQSSPEPVRPTAAPTTTGFQAPTGEPTGPQRKLITDLCQKVAALPKATMDAAELEKSLGPVLTKQKASEVVAKLQRLLKNAEAKAAA